MSVGTIVTIVLLMTVLILGLVLVRTIFTGAKYNVDQINDKVKDEINKLFSEEKNLVVYLPNNVAEIKQGESWGIAFAVYNDQESQEFEYEVKLDDSRIEDKCGVRAAEAENWIVTGNEGELPIQSGSKAYEVVRFNVPEGDVNDISRCIARFRIVLYGEDKEVFASQSFDVDVN